MQFGTGGLSSWPIRFSYLGYLPYKIVYYGYADDTAAQILNNDIIVPKTFTISNCVGPEDASAYAEFQKQLGIWAKKDTDLQLLGNILFECGDFTRCYNPISMNNYLYFVHGITLKYDLERDGTSEYSTTLHAYEDSQIG